MKKKAQGISINTIIIAAIALIVLVVLIAIFTGRLGGFSLGVASCVDKGGTCQPYEADESPAAVCEKLNAAPLRGTECAKDPDTIAGGKKGICCIPTTATE